MIARGGSGWQMVIADLSLILFMVTALALEDQPATSPDRRDKTAQPLLGEALAIYRPVAGESLPAWLAQQDADPSQQLTIIARHRPGHAGQAVQQALALAATVRPPFAAPRLMIEAAGEDDLVAVLAHDLARGLQEGGDPPAD